MESAPLSGIHSLPYETLVAIFSFLRIPDLARCATVCEQWHDIVMGCTQLWKEKRYRTERCPRECVEVYSILRALPPLEEVTVKIGEFCIDIRFPHLFLTVRDVSVLSSATYAGLLQLWNLWRLRLCDCGVMEGELEVAVNGMRCLASLHLDCCDRVSDLSCLRHCDRLQELYVETSPPDVPLTGLRYLPTGLRSLDLDVDAVAADELSEAAARLPLLEELRLVHCHLEHLDFLRRCPHLRRLCLEFAYWPDTSQLSNLRHLACLEVLDLTGCTVDADVLSGALPSLTRLHTLSLAHAADVAHLRFLRHCPQLRTLSLYGTTGVGKHSYKELCHLTNLQTLDVSFRVRAFVSEEVRPCLPKLKI